MYVSLPCYSIQHHFQMVGFPVMVPMSNIVLLLSIPDHEYHCTLSTKLRCYGEIENLVLASGNRKFGMFVLLLLSS